MLLIKFFFSETEAIFIDVWKGYNNEYMLYKKKSFYLKQDSPVEVTINHLS